MRLCRLTFGAHDALGAQILRLRRLFLRRLQRSRSTSTRASEWIDNPRPLFRFRAQTGSHRILPDIIQLHRELLAALVSPQTVIEISLLPDDAIGSRMKTFPISDDFAHRFIARER